MTDAYQNRIAALCISDIGGFGPVGNLYVIFETLPLQK